MENAVNDLKNLLRGKAEYLRGNLEDEDVKLDCIALIDAINSLEVRMYGRKITDEWTLL